MIMLFALCISTTTQLSAIQREKRVDVWIELVSTTCEPGEAVIGKVWLSYSPGVGDAITYQSHIAEVLFFFKTAFNLQIESPTTGTFDFEYVNPILCPTGPGHTVVGNSVLDVQISNFDYGCGANPSLENPLWLYTFAWRPNDYTTHTANILLEMYGTPSVALEVPDLGLWFPPKFATEKWKLYSYSTHVLITNEGCFADCDNDAQLNIDDFVCFQTQFAIGDPAADCDEDSILTIDDFICFQTLYAIGC